MPCRTHPWPNVHLANLLSDLELQTATVLFDLELQTATWWLAHNTISIPRRALHPFWDDLRATSQVEGSYNQFLQTLDKWITVHGSGQAIVPIDSDTLVRVARLPTHT